MNTPEKRELVSLLTTVALAFAVSGCAAVGTSEKDQSVRLHEAATILESKALGTIFGIESATTDTDIRRVVEADSTLLSAEAFGYSITPKSRFALIHNLRGLTAYTRALSLVGAYEHRAQFSAAVVDATGALASVAASANELKQFATDEQLAELAKNAGLLAGIIAALDEDEIDKWMRNGTVAVAARTNEHFSEYAIGLANIFSESSNIAEVGDKGLAGIIRKQVEFRKAAIAVAYQNLGERPIDPRDQVEWRKQRAEIVREFVREIRAGELSVSFAVALREACLALASAHSLLAQGVDQGFLDHVTLAIARVEYLALVSQGTKQSY